MSENDLGTFPSRAALRDRIRKAKRERRHSIGGLEPHIRRELSLQMTSNNKQHLPSIQRSSSCENMISSRHTSPSLRKKGKKFDLGTRNISVTSLGSHVSDMSSPVLNLRKFNNTSSVGSAPTGSVGSMDSAISCGSSILLDQGQQISMQQQGRRETLNLMARIAAKNSFSGQNYLQGLKYEMDDSMVSSGSLNSHTVSKHRCCNLWSHLPIANPSSLWRILWDTHLTLLLVYIAIVIPYYIGFGVESKSEAAIVFETYVCWCSLSE